MLPIGDWLCNHNLPPTSTTRGSEVLGDEALTYALISYMVRPSQVPDEVVALLAGSIFSKMLKFQEEN